MIQLHGGYGRFPDILDFSENISPLGMPEMVREAALASADKWERYPDPKCTKLRERLSEKLGAAAESIVCGNGADDLIYRIVQCLRPKKALVTSPAFSEYEKALQEADCQVSEYLLSEDNGFAVDSELFSYISEDLDMVFLCTPNNPTGRLIPPDILKKTAERCQHSGTVLVCDESFIDFVGNGRNWSLLNWLNESCIVLRSFTKFYAMAGLRLGCAVCGSSDTAERVNRTGQYWSVSVPAQAAGIAALDCKDYAVNAVKLIAKEREYLSAELSRLGIKVYPSEANYLLFRTCEGLCERLLSQGIAIRSCESYGGLDSHFYRAAVRKHKDNVRLIEAVRRCING